MNEMNDGNDPHEPHGPLEAELATLRPRELSPELRRRIGAELASCQSNPPRWRLLALAGGLAAACLTAALLLWRAGDERPIDLMPPGEPVGPALANALPLPDTAPCSRHSRSDGP